MYAKKIHSYRVGYDYIDVSYLTAPILSKESIFVENIDGEYGIWRWSGKRLNACRSGNIINISNEYIFFVYGDY